MLQQGQNDVLAGLIHNDTNLRNRAILVEKKGANGECLMRLLAERLKLIHTAQFCYVKLKPFAPIVHCWPSIGTSWLSDYCSPPTFRGSLRLRHFFAALAGQLSSQIRGRLFERASGGRQPVWMSCHPRADQ